MTIDELSSYLDPLDGPSSEPLRIRNSAKYLDHAKKEVLTARYYDIPAPAVEQAANQQEL